MLCCVVLSVSVLSRLSSLARLSQLCVCVCVHACVWVGVYVCVCAYVRVQPLLVVARQKSVAPLRMQQRYSAHTPRTAARSEVGAARRSPLEAHGTPAIAMRASIQDMAKRFKCAVSSWSRAHLSLSQSWFEAVLPMLNTLKRSKKNNINYTNSWENLLNDKIRTSVYFRTRKKKSTGLKELHIGRLDSWGSQDGYSRMLKHISYHFGEQARSSCSLLFTAGGILVDPIEWRCLI